MSLVIQHIIQLLYHNDCVILPDFGAFLTKSNPAEIDQEHHTLTPPKTSIQFSAQIKNHDGLLIKSIAEAQQISFQKAERVVNYFVADLISSLNQGEKICLKGIGQFKKEESIIFTADEAVNFSIEAYGLQTINTSILTKVEPQEKIESKAQLKHLNTDQVSKPPKLKVKHIAASLIAIGSLSIFSYNYFSQSLNQANIANEEKAQKIIENKIQSAEFSLNYNLDPVIVDKELEPNKIIKNKAFHIIAGAFRNKSNATDYLNKLLQKGYKANYIGKNKYNLHQISYASFDKQSEARKFLNKMRRLENKGAWLLVK